MFLGIMLGLAIAGLIFMWANVDDVKLNVTVRRDQWVARHVGLILFSVGACGAIGWITEVLV